LEVVELLIEKNANMAVMAKDGLTVLHHAIQNKKLEVVKLLIETHGELVSLKRRDGPSALEFAESQGTPDIHWLVSNYLAVERASC
jgi:ankyrin repeat protein